MRVESEILATVTRAGINSEWFAYLILADVPQRYRRGQSRIIYICQGRIARGQGPRARYREHRALHTLAVRSLEWFKKRAEFQRLSARVISCQNEGEAKALEGRVIEDFSHRFGGHPLGNDVSPRTMNRSRFTDAEVAEVLALGE